MYPVGTWESNKPRDHKTTCLVKRRPNLRQLKLFAMLTNIVMANSIKHHNPQDMVIAFMQIKKPKIFFRQATKADSRLTTFGFILV